MNTDFSHALLLHYNQRHAPHIIRWLKESFGCKVTCLMVDLGEIRDPAGIRANLIAAGADAAIHLDARNRFADEIISRAIKANAVYEGGYHLSAALARPLLAMVATDFCRSMGMDVVVHGFRGNDQVRMEMGFQSLGQPSIPALARMDLEDKIVDAYAREHGILEEFGTLNPYSTSENIWGKSIECGPLENPWEEAPLETWSKVNPVESTPLEPAYVEISFEEGIPIAFDGAPADLGNLLERLNWTAAEHGVGRTDIVENGFVGLKSRAIYESPAAHCLILAHADLEGFTSNCHETAFKRLVDGRWTDLVYSGRWFDPVMDHLNAYIDNQNQFVAGTIRLKLHRGSVRVVGRHSAFAVYDPDRAIYQFGHGFAKADASAVATLANLPTMAALIARGECS
jgi:argininosuccinate synthase